MARIRSIHPGLFTDEAFASLSMPARVLLLGIWTESDDQGVFEWKPITLKMRVFSADNLDVVPLLSELERADAVRKFSFEGKPHGAVRNFCKYQKPKTPKFRDVRDDEIRNYVASKYPKEETGKDNPAPFPQKGEMERQREEGRDSFNLGVGLGEGAKPALAKALNSNFGREGPLTLEFVASDETIQTIRASGFGEKQFNNEFSKFVAYYMARGAVRADWNAQLVSWFQRAKPDAAQAAPAAMVNQVFVVEGTPEWSAWTQFWRETKRKSVPLTDGRTPNGALQRGWYFPTAVPPGYDEATGERIAPSNQEENAA